MTTNKTIAEKVSNLEPHAKIENVGTRLSLICTH